MSRIIFVRFSQRSDVEFGNLLLVLAVEMIVLLVDGLKRRHFKMTTNYHPTPPSPSRSRDPWRGSGSISRARCTSPSWWGTRTGPGSSQMSGHTHTAGASSWCPYSSCHQLNQDSLIEYLYLCCVISYHNMASLRCISTCKARSKGGCTPEPCRRSWCSTSHASYSNWK